MKNQLLPVLLFIIAFANCEMNPKNIERQPLELQKGLVINTSMTFENNGEVMMTNNDLDEKIITIEGDSLTVDFNHISLIGTDDFTTPDQFKGVAIYIKNSQNITIKNLNVSGYRIALQADSVQNLTIDSCNFSYNYRADSTVIFDIKNVETGGIVLNYSKHIDILNSTISHNYNGIVLNHSILNELKQSKVQFNSKVGLYGSESGFQNVEQNQIDWNLTAGIWDVSNTHMHYINHNSLTHNGLVFINIPIFNADNDFTASKIDLEIKENQNLEKVPILNPKYPKGEAYKLPTKYGVYDFEYPAIFLRTVDGNRYTFAMFGATIGNWKFVNAKNVRFTNLKTGTFPATFIIEKEDIEKPFSIDFEFIGSRFQNEFGIWNEKGKVFKFGFSE